MSEQCRMNVLHYRFNQLQLQYRGKKMTVGLYKLCNMSSNSLDVLKSTSLASQTFSASGLEVSAQLLLTDALITFCMLARTLSLPLSLSLSRSRSLRTKKHVAFYMLFIVLHILSFVGFAILIVTRSNLSGPLSVSLLP